MLSIYMKKISGKIDYFVSSNFGHRFPFYYVCEYPRSGGTWVAHMLSDYLQISFPKNSIFPLGHSCIIHNHWKYNPKFDKPVYVVRDGRDVAVSTMYYALKNSKKSKYYLNYYRSKFPQMFNEIDSNHTEKRLFQLFLSDWVQGSSGTSYSWAEHVRQWAFSGNVILARYEDFHSNSFESLKNILFFLGLETVDEELINYTIRKFSFEKQTGRKPGEDNIKDNKRKGIIGDWKNYFDYETAKLMNQYAGDVLLKMKYEKDIHWVEKFNK